MYPDMHMGSNFNVSLPPSSYGDLAWARNLIDQTCSCADRLLSAGLADGGTAGLIWGFVGVCVGFSLVYASVAEMASM